jgi:hypothetical protein
VLGAPSARTLSSVETIDRDSRVTEPRGPIGWWYGGLIIDLVHMPIVLVLVALGASWWSGPVYVGVISAVVIVQVALLGCPVLAMTGWMKRKYDPEYQGGWSFTVWLYHRYGRWAGIAVFLFFLAAAVVVRIVTF